MNPFAHWKVWQQTTGFDARDAADMSIDALSPFACKWCAVGMMILRGIEDPEFVKFDEFCERTFKSGVIDLNDRRGFAPAQFAAAWDEFQNESHAR